MYWVIPYKWKNLRKVIYAVFFILGINFILDSLVGLYPSLLMTIQKQWLGYADYLADVFPDTLSHMDSFVLFHGFGLLYLLLGLVAGFLLLFSYRTGKRILVCGILLMIADIISCFYTGYIYSKPISFPFKLVCYDFLIVLYAIYKKCFVYIT